MSVHYGGRGPGHIARVQGGRTDWIFTSGGLDSRITFTRASSGTYFDSAGVMQTATTDVPRFNYEYNGTSWAAKGLLIEPAATNLLLRSTTFNNGWTASGATVTGNSTTAPDGTTAADTIVENASTSTHGVYQAATLTAATYTYSVFAKAGTRSWLFLTCTPSSAFGAYFNLSDGTVGTVTAGYTATISAVGNGWYRCAISFTATAATWYSNVLVATANGTSSYTGDGASGLYAWGAQLESGSVASSFIETTTATATRAADVASITGSNFSSWFNQTEGTFVAEFTPALISDQSTVFSVSDGTTNERMHSSAGGSIHLYVVDGGLAQVSIDAGSHDANTSRKIATAYKVNDFAASINGGAAVADTSGTLPTVDRLNIGSFTSGNLQLNGHIARITYYPTRLSNAQLVTLST